MKGPPEKAARACPDPRWDGTTSRNTCERVTWDREGMGDGARERPWPGSRGPSPIIIPRAWGQGQGSLIFCRCRIRKRIGLALANPRRTRDRVGSRSRRLGAFDRCGWRLVDKVQGDRSSAAAGCVVEYEMFSADFDDRQPRLSFLGQVDLHAIAHLLYGDGLADLEPVGIKAHTRSFHELVI